MNTPSDATPPQPEPEQPEPEQPEPEQPDGAGRRDRDATLAPSAPPAPILPAPILPAPILPAQSREDTDVGWGDYGERDDNDRLLRDRPPHWDDA